MVSNRYSNETNVSFRNKKRNNYFENYFVMSKKEAPLTNQNLAKSIADKGGNKAKIARELGMSTGQGIGLYVKGRAIPIEFVQRWKEVYGEDLMAKHSETIVSRETTSLPPLISSPDYVGLHHKAWEEFQETLRHSRKLLTDITKNNSQLTKNNTSLTHDIAQLVAILAKPHSN